MQYDHTTQKFGTALRLRFFVMLSSALCAASSGKAQSIADLPTAAEPGRIGIEAMRQNIPITQQRTRTREAKILPLPPVGEETVLFTLQRVILNGDSTLNKDAVAALWQDALGGPITETIAAALVERLNTLYRNQGYVLSDAVLDPAASDPANGILAIAVRERSLHDVTFTTDTIRIAQSSFLSNIRKTLLADKPLRHKTVERALFLLQDMPGITTESVLNPTDEGFVLAITLKQKYWESEAGIDNRNTPYTGPWQTSIAQQRNGVLGAFDQISARLSKSTDNQELTSASMAYITPVSTSGTLLILSAQRILSEPGATIASLELESANTEMGISLRHPLERSRYQNFWLSVDFSSINSNGKSFGSVYTRDRVRSVGISGTYDLIDRWGGAQNINIGLTQGIPLLGSSQNGDDLLSRDNGRVDFTKVTVSTSRLQVLTARTQVLAVLSGQYAFSQLLSGEEFGFGGLSLGRGYDSSTITGDHGASALVEFRFSPELPKNYSPSIGTPQFYASYDFGSVWRIDSNTRVARMTGASVAVGARLKINNTLAIDASLARPLTRPIDSASEASASDVRPFIITTVRF
jgi:hemolysin activation/secretion protein